MSEIYQSEWWSVSLPSGWKASADETCVTIVSPGETGAVQISAYRKDTEVDEEDLHEFAAEDIPAGVPVADVQLAKLSGLHIHYCLDDTYWREWWLRAKCTLVYVTYNCSVRDQDIDKRDVDEMLNSLRVKN